MRPFLSLIWKTEDNRRSVNMSGPVTCAFGSISLKSIFTRALVRSQGIVTLSIHITTVCSVQTFIYVWDNKMNIIRMWRLFCSGFTNFRIHASVSCCLIRILSSTVCLISLISFLALAGARSNGVIACGITLTAMITRQALVHVYKRKEKTIIFI